VKAAIIPEITPKITTKMKAAIQLKTVQISQINTIFPAGILNFANITHVITKLIANPKIVASHTFIEVAT